MRYALGDKTPQIDGGVFVAPTATIIGQVTIAGDASVWFGAVIRGDVDSISIGSGTNVQDGTVIHCNEGFPTRIGDGVTIGHTCIVHGCTIGDNCLIGMGTTILNGASLGENCLVGAGSLITEGKEFPPGSVIMGRPAKVVRQVGEAELAMIRRGADNYRRNSQRYKEGLREVPV
ncbi:MAG: gamma carbonic anhydrase family protein [Bacillota bacterium]